MIFEEKNHLEHRG